MLNFYLVSLSIYQKCKPREILNFVFHFSQIAENGIRVTGGGGGLGLWLSQKFSEVLSALGSYAFLWGGGIFIACISSKMREPQTSQIELAKTSQISRAGNCANFFDCIITELRTSQITSKPQNIRKESFLCF